MPTFPPCSPVYTPCVQADDELADAIEAEYYRFEPYLAHAVQRVVGAGHADYLFDNDKTQR
ncbi:hypothetical protein EON64_16310 [archaeon]|nr:MAG: hypothetical protein EON64_16310 [archaeon]